MISDDQLWFCDFDLPAGQVHVLLDAWEGPRFRIASLRARKGVGMNAVISGNSTTALKQLYSTLSTVSQAMADYFFPSASWGPVPTSDYCKELTVKLTSFFFLPVLCYLFFLTPVAKYSHGFRKVQPGTKVRNCTNRNRERVGKQCGSEECVPGVENISRIFCS